MDPYVVFVYNNKKQTSTTLDEAGQQPDWKGEKFEFEIQDLQSSIEMKVMDKDVFGSDHVGSADISIELFTRYDACKEWVQLLYKKKNAG